MPALNEPGGKAPDDQNQAVNGSALYVAAWLVTHVIYFNQAD